MGILESLAALLIILWIIGLALHIAGSLIHLLLLVAVILIIVRFVRGAAKS